MATHKIMVNCGHGRSSDGSWDPGCAWGKYTEADLMLPITKAAVAQLRAKDVTVLSDADTCNDKNMVADVAWANREGVELYVSIHCDYSGAPIGAMPLYVSEQGKKLAEALNRSITSGMDMASRGVQKRTDLYELNDTDMPACVLETGSIRLDLSFLKQPEKYGKCIAEGICSYLGIKEEPMPKAPEAEYKKYKALRNINVYKDHSIISGRVGTAKKGSLYTASDWYRDDWCYIPYLKGWVPIKGSRGTYLEPVTKIEYTVTNPGGVNIYPDVLHKGKMIVNVKRGSELTATRWIGNQAYFPSVGGWGATSCITQGNRRTVFLGILARIGLEMSAAGYRYSKYNNGVTYAKSKKNKLVDCAHYVSYAMQELGLLKYGKCIWLDTTIHGTGADDVRSSDLLQVTYPRHLWSEIDLKPGDICGYGYSTGQHTQVFSGYDKAGKPLFYTGGTLDVNNGNFGPKRKTWYENEPIDVLIRIKI